MFYWEENTCRDEPFDTHEGDIRPVVLKGTPHTVEDRVIGIFSYVDLGYWVYALPPIMVGPAEHLKLINLFVESCDTSFSKDTGVIVGIEFSGRSYRDIQTSMPLAPVDGMFCGVPLDRMSYLRFDVPKPMVADPPIEIHEGEIIPSIGPLGVMGFSFTAVYGREPWLHNICVADTVPLPVEALADYYSASTKRVLSAAGRASLVELIAAHGRLIY